MRLVHRLVVAPSSIGAGVQHRLYFPSNRALPALSAYLSWSLWPCTKLYDFGTKASSRCTATSCQNLDCVCELWVSIDDVKYHVPWVGRYEMRPFTHPDQEAGKWQMDSLFLLLVVEHVIMLRRPILLYYKISSPNTSALRTNSRGIRNFRTWI